MSSIDTTGMSEGKKAALELTESSRESFHGYPTFAGAIFMGELHMDLIHPCSEAASNRDARGREFLTTLEAFLKEHADPDQIDRDGEIPDCVVEGLAALGASGSRSRGNMEASA